ncbi:MAG: deoxyribonuclease IV [Fimbriimonadales bacterium]
MPAKYLGAHMPIKGGIGNALRRGKEIGCTAVQVFTSSPRQWYAPEVSAEQVADFKKAQAETGIDHVVSHDTYLINLCAPTPEIREKSIASLKKELGRCGAYGIPCVVSHIGSLKDQNEGEALLAAAEGMKEVLADTPESVMLLMETTAGQGSSLNARFEQMAMLLELTGGHKRIGVCLDTCHVFAAGYDIRTPEAFAATFAEFDRVVGMDRLKAIHVNDSQKGLGSRVDRHAHIGEGEIGIEAFRCLVNDPRLAEIPMTLETPDADEMHKVNLDRLWALEQA